MAERDLVKTSLTGDVTHGPLMGGIAIGVHEYYRHGLQATGPGPRQNLGVIRCLKRRDHRAVGGQALVNLQHLLVKRLWQLDVEGKNIRAVLIADFQNIGIASSGDKKGSRALAFQQGIGGDRRTHAHAVDQV